MQVILREDVRGLGRTGDIVRVKPGYARNYLVPSGLAVRADPKNLKHIEHEKALIAKKTEKDQKTAEALKGRLEKVSVTVSKHAGEGDKLYGSVTAKDIAFALEDEGIVLDRKKIRIDEPIKQLGVHAVTVVLQPGNEVPIKVWVVAK